MTWFDAYDHALAPLLAARKCLALLTAAEHTGMLTALREERTPDDLAADLGLAPDVVAAACRALRACEVLEERPAPGGATYRLGEAWRTLTGPAAFSPF